MMGEWPVHRNLVSALASSALKMQIEVRLEGQLLFLTDTFEHKRYD
jgi:hypothetical protein